MYATLRRSGLIIILLPAVAACITRPVEKPPIQVNATNYQEIPQTLEKDIDILFVIDNSGSMKEEQDNLIRNFDAFIDALKMPQLAGKLPNVRIGVVSTDVGIGEYSNKWPCDSQCGDMGLLQRPPASCSVQLPANESWISYTVDDGGNESTNLSGGPANAIGKVKAAFTCMAELGIEGCGFEQSFASALWALDPSGIPEAVSCPGLPATGRSAQNPGFLRPAAFLAVVFITDEDDCSARSGALFVHDSNQNEDAGRFHDTVGSPLGPWQSYRCFEFAMDCTGFTENTALSERRKTPASWDNCVPTTTKFRNGDPETPWLTPVDDYVDFFRNVKPRPGRVILFGIAGPVPKGNSYDPRVNVKETKGFPDLKESCIGDTNNDGIPDTGVGVPALRLENVISAHGSLGHFNVGLTPDGQNEEINICSQDFSSPLRKLGDVIVATLGGQCISRPLITENGGLVCKSGLVLGTTANGPVACTADCLDQANCQVADVTGQYTDNPQEVPIAKCSADLFNNPAATDCGTTCPCWRIVASGQCDPTSVGSPFGLDVLRQNEPEQGSVAKIFCSTTSIPWTDTAALIALPQCNAVAAAAE